MIDAIHDKKLKAMYVFGEEMSLVDSNANYVEDALTKLDFLRDAGDFLHGDVPLCRCDSAGEPEPGKGRDVHQHGTADPAACIGCLSRWARAGQTGRLFRSCEPAGRAAGRYAHPAEIYRRLLR
jgi:hypothetical protein